MRLGCADAANALGLPVTPGYFPAKCCQSCHEDAEYGYPLSDIEMPDGTEYAVCCRFAELLAPTRWPNAVSDD